MRTLGWTVVVLGLAWIVCCDVLNWVNIKSGPTHIREDYFDDRAYSRDEVVEAARKTSIEISRRNLSSTWGGILMLAGVLILEVAHAKKRK